MASQLNRLPFAQTTIYDDVIAGLRRRPRRIPAKYLYDEGGRELFEAISELDEYYLTRSELALLSEHGEAIAEMLPSQGLVLELGPGNGRKARRLLAHLQAPAGYIPVDFSQASLDRTYRDVVAELPELPIEAVRADFTTDWRLPLPARSGPRIFYVPGSTIGDLPSANIKGFLRRLASQAGPDGALLIGVDLIKEPTILEMAYGDPEGYSAAFHLNVLRRINRECNADFDLDGFRHRRRYDRESCRVNAYLISTQDQVVSFPTTRFHIKKGDAILTESSQKFSIEAFASLSESAGWRTRAFFSDDEQFFSLWVLYPRQD